MTDFLITFTVDGTQAIRMMEEIGAQATALEARLNALGRGPTRSNAASNILNNLGLSPSNVQAASTALTGLERQVANLSAARNARTQLGLPQSASSLATEAVATRRLAESLGQAHPRYSQLIADSDNLASQSRNLSAHLDETTQSFGRHTRRIFEAILIYEAFGRAIQGLRAGIGTVIDIERESRRLQAVLNTNPAQTGQFITNLGKIASQTVTPIDDLISESDRASSAFLDIADPAQRAAASLELMRDAGKFNVVTQRDLGVEVTNLIAIMKQLNIPIGDLDDFLGKIVVAGGNASSVISGLSDSLQISSRAAQQSGVDLNALLAIESQFLIETGRSGTEVGNLFKTLFQRISNPTVAKKVGEITGGLLRMRDAAGRLRDPIQILLELKALLDQGAISATQFNDVLAAIAPQLNQSAKADFALIVDQLGQIGPRVRDISQASASSLDDLVNKINDALGPQFQKLIIDAQVAFANLFGPSIIAGGQAFIQFIRAIGTTLSAIPTPLLTIIGDVTALFVAFKTLAFFGRGLLAILGLTGITGAFGAGAVAAEGEAASVGLLTTAMTGLRAVAATLLPILIAIAAVEIGAHLVDEAQKIDQLRKAGFSDQQAHEAINGPTAQRSGRVVGVGSAFGEKDPNATGLTDNQRENLNRLAQAMKQAEDAGTSTADSQAKMKAAILDTNGAVKTELVSINDIVGATTDLATTTQQTGTSFAQANDQALAYARGLSEVDAQQKLTRDSGAILSSLHDEQADALVKLNERLKEGKISLDAFTQGQDQVSRAADLAAQLTAAYGDRLRTIIPELGNAKEGNDNLAAAVFQMVLNSGDALPAIDNLIQKLVQLAVSSAESASIVVSSANTITAAFQAIASARFIATRSPFGTGPGGPFLEGVTNQQAQAIASGAPSLAGLTTNLDSLVRSLFGALRNSFQRAGNTTFGTGIPSTSGGGGSRTTRQPASILDIEKLPRSMIPQLIAIATRLRNRIPGERRESQGDIVSLIRNGKFLQNVRNIDDRLLRIALDRLTEQIQKQNEREERNAQRNNILRNLTVNAGPLGALVSQPTAFGVAGSLAAGNGLNFNPNKGNFVINVPVTLKGLTPAKLQQLIYNIIGKAIRDALRL